MIVRSLGDIIGTARDVRGPGWNSRRLLLASDGMGYALTDTIVEAGTPMTLEYKHHFEACYCIAGRGEITAASDGVTHPIKPFVLYALDKHDLHTVQAIGGDLRLICVFNPPLTGSEVHGADGSYAAPE